MNSVIEKFYLSLLDYAGLKYESDNIVDKTGRINTPTIEGCSITLPYMSNLKNPNGRVIFHPLNENYASPENTVFNLFKSRLSTELNLRTISLVTSLIALASDAQMQRKVKTKEGIALISAIGEAEMVSIENFVKLIKASSQENQGETVFSIFLKKNGEINGVPYSAIGKVNHHLYKAICESLEAGGDYRVYGVKSRKKDLVLYKAILSNIFDDIDDKDSYIDGSNNKIFRYLNTLMKTCYMVSSVVNKKVECLLHVKEPVLELESVLSSHDWIDPLEELQGMASEIRMIPSQVDQVKEAKEMGKLKLDESASAQAQVVKQETQLAPVFSPQQAQPQPQQSQPVQAGQPAPQAPQPMRPEDLVRAQMQGGMMYPQQNMPVFYQQPMMPGFQQPVMMPGFQQAQTPNWANQQQQLPQPYAQGMPAPAPQVFQQQMPMSYQQPMPGFQNQPFMQQQNLPNWANPQQQQPLPQAFAQMYPGQGYNQPMMNNGYNMYQPNQPMQNAPGQITGLSPLLARRAQ